MIFKDKKMRLKPDETVIYECNAQDELRRSCKLHFTETRIIVSKDNRFEYLEPLYVKNEYDYIRAHVKNKDRVFNMAHEDVVKYSNLLADVIK